MAIDGVEIREALESDAPALAELAGQLGYPSDPAIIRERIHQLGESRDHSVLVACIAGVVVGWVDIVIIDHLVSGRRGEIAGLIVSSKHRNARIGTQLLREAEGLLARAGLDTVVVRSRTQREDAHRFYVREGYRLTKTSAVFSKPLTVRS